MNYFIAFILCASLSGCRDFKMVLGDDSSETTDSQEENTDSKNTTTTTSAGKSMLDWGNQ